LTARHSATTFDAIYKRFDRPEAEHQTLEAAARRIEEKLES